MTSAEPPDPPGAVSVPHAPFTSRARHTLRRTAERLRTLAQPAGALHSIRRALPDALGLAIAAAYGAPSVAYKFGRDQAIFYYIGREWLRGRIPYRDAFDLKPPAIYLLHAVCIALFGPHIWAIRLMELLGVLACGAMIALCVRRDGRRAPGEIGASAMLLSAWYFTNFDFWDSGQVEIWVGIFLIASYLALEKGKNFYAAFVGAGLLAGTAAMFKTTAALGGTLLGMVAIARGATFARPGASWLRRAGRGIAAGALYSLGVGALIGGFVLYFTAKGAFHSLVELAGYTKQYAKWAAMETEQAKATLKLWWITRNGQWVAFFLFAWLIGLWQATNRGARRVSSGAWVSFGLMLCAFGSVAVQRRFFSYHWGVMAPFLVLCAAYGIAEVARVAPGAAYLAGVGALFGGALSAPQWFTNGTLNYRDYAIDQFWEYAQGRKTHAQFSQIFTAMNAYNFAAQEHIAEAINARKRPGDRLHVRGFELSIYALTGLSSPSRFVSEIPLDDAALAFNRDAWLAEHERALFTNPPRFFVAFHDRPADVAALHARGYRDVQRDGLFLLMQRGP